MTEARTPHRENRELCRGLDGEKDCHVVLADETARRPLARYVAGGRSVCSTCYTFEQTKRRRARESSGRSQSPEENGEP